MNNGVDLVIDNSITGEPTETNNSGGQDWFQSLLSFAVQSPIRKRNYTNRHYQVIRRKDGVTAIQTGIAQSVAYRLKRRYHQEGFSVDLIEECNLTGEVIRSLPSDDKIPTPFPYRTNSQKSRFQASANKLASLQVNRVSLENARRNARKDQNKSYVYDKASGLLVFSGAVDDACNFVTARMENGIWNIGDWVIYLPQKIWNQLGGIVNG